MRLFHMAVQKMASLLLPRRFRFQTRLVVEFDLQHNGDVEVERIEDYLRDRVCGFQQSGRDDQWIVTDPRILQEGEEPLL